MELLINRRAYSKEGEIDDKEGKLILFQSAAGSILDRRKDKNTIDLSLRVVDFVGNIHKLNRV